MKIAIIALALALSLNVCGQPKAGPPSPAVGITLTYVGNEGVLISDGAKAVLVDGLHREYGPDYLFPPPQMLSAMETAEPPFDKVRSVLVSHIHLDHFHAESIGLHLKNNPKATLISSSQTMAEIARNYKDHDQIRAQTREMTPEWKQRLVYQKDGIKVTLLGLKHGSERFWWIKNLGHIIEIGGKRFFHFGDADVSVENFASLNLPAEKIDVAFVPYWFLLSDAGRKIVHENIAAATNIAVHIPPATAEKDAENVKALFPGVEAFIKIGQQSIH